MATWFRRVWERRRDGATRALAGLLAAGLVLRIVFIVFWTPTQPPDAGLYDSLARSLLKDGAFPSACRSPGYPALLAGIYWLTGGSRIAVFLLQAAVSTAAAWLIYRIGEDIFGRRRRGVSLLAAALVGLNPEIASYSVLLLREAVCVALVPLAAWLCLRTLGYGSRYGWALGATLGVLAYVRTEACLLVVVMLAGAALRQQWRARAIRGALIAGTVAIAVAGPWILHSARARGYAGMQVVLAPNLFSRSWYLAPEGGVERPLRRRIRESVARAGLTDEQIRYHFLIPPLLLRHLPQGDVRAEADLYRKLGRIAWENIRQHWMAYLRDSFLQWKAMMGGYSLAWWSSYFRAPPFPENVERGQWGIVAVKVANRVLWPVVVLFLATAALLDLWCRPEKSAAWAVSLLVAGALACVVLVCLVTFASPRLRLPYEGMMYLAACYGAWAVMDRCRGRKPIPKDNNGLAAATALQAGVNAHMVWAPPAGRVRNNTIAEGGGLPYGGPGR